jgi:pimeloyl-ACP methyl ester carboxylesterase
MTKRVASADGTSIACEQAGNGPHLVLVHGTSADRRRWAAIRPHFERHFTVTAIDRRGRGDSGDAPQYAVEREFEDVAAVIAALEGRVLLFGHSYGALCSLEAALLTDRLAGLVLYEPPIFEGVGLHPSDLPDRLEAMLAGGDRDRVIRTFLAEATGMPAEEISRLASLPAWTGRLAAAHTLPRELRTVDDYRLRAGRFGRLSIPTLLLLGGNSAPNFGKAIATLEKALPNARTLVLPGQKHVAMDTAPEMVVAAVIDFWREVG